MKRLIKQFFKEIKEFFSDNNKNSNGRLLATLIIITACSCFGFSVIGLNNTSLAWACVSFGALGVTGKNLGKYLEKRKNNDQD